MNVALWVIASVLAVAFAAAGMMKLVQPKAKLADSGQAWVEQFSPMAVKAIGALEVAAAVALIVPAVLDVTTILVPLAAVGLALMMNGAAVTHARRRELPNVAVNLVLMVLAVVVAVGRFGPEAF